MQSLRQRGRYAFTSEECGIVEFGVAGRSDVDPVILSSEGSTDSDEFPEGRGKWKRQQLPSFIFPVLSNVSQCLSTPPGEFDTADGCNELAATPERPQKCHTKTRRKLPFRRE